MANLVTVRLNKGDSPTWGFRLQGGKDFGTPLVIQKVNGGSPAERAGLVAGDSVIKINNIDVYNLLHKEAQDVIVRSGSNFDMVIQRGGSTWKPSVTPAGSVPKPSPVISNFSPVTKTSLAATKGENIDAIGTGHNLSAKPFSPQVNGTVNGNNKLINKQYNSPIKLYSEDAIAETLSAQTEVLSTGALGVNFKKNEKDYDATNSAVYRMLKEAESDPDPSSNDAEPESGIVTSSNKGVAGLRHVQAPQNKPAPANPQLPPGQNICAECERLIVGVFVRIKEKNLHVECFKCSTCGSSLKNVGYYNINNKLYCDIHAKSAAIAVNNPSAIPITLPPGGKAPASAISAALSSHSLPSPSPLSPKLSPYAPSYPPAEELKPAHPVEAASTPFSPLPPLSSSIESSPSTNPIPKPSSNPNLYNPATPLSFSKFLNKSPGTSGPKPFSSVSAPLSPGGTLPRAAPLSPQNNFTKAPLSPPSAPSYGSYSPLSTTERCTNITWPPSQDPDLPTACPLFYPPPSRVEAELVERKTRKKSQFESEYFCEENLDSEDVIMDENTSFYSEELSFSDRRSATECVEILSETIDTQKLVENVIKSSPILVPPSLNVSEKIELKSESCAKKQERLDITESSELKRPTQYNPNTVEYHKVPRVENTVPQKWESSLTQAVRTVATDSDTFCRMPSRGAPSPMRSALTIAPAQPFNPQNQNILEPVPLPEETEPYFPPEHPILPVKRECESKKTDKPPVPKPKSPFVRALETAPDRPFTPVGGGAAPAPPPVKKKPKDALDELLGELPRPFEKIDMRSALTTAPERPYSPLTIEQRAALQETTSKRGSIKSTDRSCLMKLLKPEELPKSFKMNEKEPKPPSYYAPVVIEERIKAQSEESHRATESKQTKIIEQQTIQPGRVSQQVIKQEVPSSDSPTAFAPIFQGFSCYFKSSPKSDITEFSVEVSTTPPIPTPPPKPQTPISYIATVEEKPTRITTQKIFEERSGSQQTSSKRQEKVRTEIRQQKQQDVEKQAEEVVRVKPLPVGSLLHKPDTLPSYQKELKATAEADLILMERRQKAQERLEEQKRKCVIQQQQQSQQVQQQSIRTGNICKKEETIRKDTPPKPERCTIKPIIKVEPDDSGRSAISASFQPVSDKPQSTTFSPRPRSITPSMINKAPPILPYYQENLVAHFHTAVETNILDPTSPEISRSPSPRPDARSRSPSPFPSRFERAKSPAEGPPPNPLKSSKPFPTPQDTKVKQAKQNVQSYLSGHRSRESREVVEHATSGNEAESMRKQVSVSQNVAYPVSSVESTFCVQTGKVQQHVDCCEKQKMQVTEAQKQESQVAKYAGGCSKTDISEKSRQEQLAAERRSQSQSVETSADGRTQIQRKKMVTEEYERSHKETNIQIEKNITSCSVSNKNQFSKVNVPINGGPVVQSFHVTNPRHMTSFESKELLSSQQESQKVDTQRTLQQASQKLSQSCDSQATSSSCPIAPTTQPAVRHVYAPSSIAPVKHVSSPNCNRKPCQNITKPNVPVSTVGSGTGRQAGGISVAPKRGRGVLNPGTLGGARIALCGHCHSQVRGPFITALGKIWCPQHFICTTPSCKRPLQDLGFVEERGQLYCEYCFEQYLAPPCSKCNSKIKGDCLKAIGKNFHPECFNCCYCGKLFGNNPFFLEDGNPYCEADWNELFTTKCFACGFPVEAGDRWVEALNNNYHSQCFNCTMCKKNLEGQSFFAKGGRPFCKNHAR
ncbi:Z band alternatively spliced PDZ-motif protein 52 isoform X2 [Rhynchophorus ferrugineus]|uniref:Z band alternatively spliced PDZ-motif protein 52 isoform X2 n=2 Tax=Rhynchophorus ferrugineus TaxID=354439 RepID=UPI003FCC50A1